MTPLARALEGAPTRDWPRFALSLAFNMIPLAGVLFWGWSAFELIFLYWLENVAIGARTFIMIVLSGRYHGIAGALGLALFFTIHYGIFCTVHGAFVIGLFGGVAFGDAVDIVAVLHSLRIGIAAIILWQLALLVLHVASGDRSEPNDIMGAPYPRIIALHVTILGGGILLMALNWPHAGVVVLAIIKTAMDASLALRGTPVGHAPQAQQSVVSSPSPPPHP